MRLGIDIGFQNYRVSSVSPPTPSQEVWDIAPAAGVSVTISVDRSNLRAAPEAMGFQVTTTGFTSNMTAGVAADRDPGFHDLWVFWDYGDSYTFTAPTQIIAWDAIDGGGRSGSGRSIGPIGSHTYRSAGNYVVRAAVYEPSTQRWGQATFNIGGASENTPTVQSGATVFPTTQTIFVDTTGTYTNAPTGSQNTTSIDGAVNTLLSATTPHRIVLERGQTHTFTSGYNFARYLVSPDPVLSFRMEANTGAGAKPIVTINDANFGPGGTLFNDALTAGDNPTIDADNVFSGLDLRGLWDSTTESGDSVNFLGSFDRTASYTMFDDCDATGWKILFNSGLERTKEYYFNDCDVRNWQLYGIFFDGSQSSAGHMVGCRVTQDVDALAGGPTSPENSRNNQGPFRNAGSRWFMGWANDVFSNSGQVQRGSIFEPQPCARMLQNMTTAGKKGYFGGSVLEGGATMLAIENSEEGNTDKNVNGHIWGNMMIASWQTGRGFGINHSGITFHGNTITTPGVSRISTAIGGPDAFAMAFVRASRSNAGGAVGAYDDPVRVFNNTFVSLLSDSDVTFGDATCSVIDTGLGSITVTEENNIVHQPNIGTPQTASAPLTATQIVTPRLKGYRDANNLTLLTQYATPAVAGSIYEGTGASTALDGATTGNISALGNTPDYSDTPIVTNRDVGAVEA